MNRSTSSLRDGRRAQTFISLGLLASVLASCCLVAAMAHSKKIEAWLTTRDAARFRVGAQHMSCRSNRLDFEDKWILDDLPDAARPGGGVYFFGTSAMKWGLANWDIPGHLKPHVANYSIGATSHELQYELIRYLVEHEDLLQAGADRTHIVLGLYWSMGQYWRPQGFFGPLWERHGLYRYDASIGIVPVADHPIVTHLKRERARACSFIGGNLHRLARTVSLALGFRITETENIRDPGKIREWAQRLAVRDDWEPRLARQMEALDGLVGYLAARNVGVTIVLLPERQPFEDLPMPAAYRRQLAEFCGIRDVPFVDLSRRLPEDEFWDMNHTNYAGLMDTHAVLMQLAEDRLRTMGVIP